MCVIPLFVKIILKYALKMPKGNGFFEKSCGWAFSFSPCNKYCKDAQKFCGKTFSCTSNASLVMSRTKKNTLFFTLSLFLSLLQGYSRSILLVLLIFTHLNENPIVFYFLFHLLTGAFGTNS